MHRFLIPLLALAATIHRCQSFSTHLHSKPISNSLTTSQSKFVPSIPSQPSGSKFQRDISVNFFGGAEFFSLYSLIAFLLYGGGVYATIKTERPDFFTETDFGGKVKALKNKIKPSRKKEEEVTIETAFKDEIAAPIEKAPETTVEEVERAVEAPVAVEENLEKVENIIEVKKRVASTKKGAIEQAQRLQKIMEEEQKSFINPVEAGGYPIVAGELQDAITPKKKGFSNRVKRIAKKVIMPWRKFSDIQ